MGIDRYIDTLVLAGGGHAHALLLAHWARQSRLRPPGAVLLISRRSTMTYSGLVPAVVAGLVPPAAARVDLAGLCRRAGVTLLVAEIVGLDPVGRRLELAGRAAVPFRWLSLNVGAVPAAVAAPERPVRPLDEGLAQLLALTLPGPGQPPLPGLAVRIRGGGATAVELALALRARGLAPRLLLRGQRLRLGPAAAARCAEALLAAAGIAVERGVGLERPADLACTGGLAPPWLAAAGLPVDPASGRVLTADTLQVIGHPWLFATGDCALVASRPRPAAGVWAVRAELVLARNLARAMAGRPGLQHWRPPPWALQLIGDGGAVLGRPRALGLWGPLVLGPTGMLWRLKRALDQRFLARLRRQGG
ncbi:MAG: hypothetical protein VKM01_07665 [Cyanobacteriota bacterium]|nr:hypothetical protein [Cyanobacteriota bacterium]